MLLGGALKPARPAFFTAMWRAGRILVARFMSMVLRSSAFMTSISADWMDSFSSMQASGCRRGWRGVRTRGGVGGWVQAGLARSAPAAMHALVVVAELPSAKRRRAATDAGDLDMSAGFSVFH